MEAGPVEDGVPPPIGYGLRSPLSQWLAEIPPGKSRHIQCPPDRVEAVQIAVGSRAYRLWGRGGHVTRAVPGGVRVWRLTEDQRAALLARRTKRDGG